MVVHKALSEKYGQRKTEENYEIRIEGPIIVLHIMRNIWMGMSKNS